MEPKGTGEAEFSQHPRRTTRYPPRSDRRPSNQDISPAPGIVAQDELLAKGRGGVRVLIGQSPWNRLSCLYWEGLHLASTRGGTMGAFSSSLRGSVVVCFLCLLSTVGRMVHIWNYGGLHLWDLERVSEEFALMCKEG